MEGVGASTIEGSGDGEGAAVGTATAVADGDMMREKMGRRIERRRRFRDSIFVGEGGNGEEGRMK